jgi:hypothetical protein
VSGAGGAYDARDRGPNRKFRLSLGIPIAEKWGTLASGGLDTGSRGNRWIQLVLGLLCIVAISSPHYVWALFTKPLTDSLGVNLAQVQVTFSLLIVLQTFLSPWQGFLIVT